MIIIRRNSWNNLKESTLKLSFWSVPGMALIQSETVRPQVFTAKCSEPQAIAVKWGGEEAV